MRNIEIPILNVLKSNLFKNHAYERILAGNKYVYVVNFSYYLRQFGLKFSGADPWSTLGKGGGGGYNPAFTGFKCLCKLNHVNESAVSHRIWIFSSSILRTIW